MSENFPLAGSRHGNYIVRQHLPIAELNLTLIVLQHEPTGARLAHLACDDPNNVFAVGFRTPPPDSSGVAHILEHTVLCGSEHYPVRDPFFAMLKRSLNTFMNAMTSADWTFYPIASMNRKDFNNLMGIYLDATFFPLLRKNDFRQEGHRLEFSDPQDMTSPLEIKGVVFNEMKGAMADPSSLLGRRLSRALFPTSCYGENSGGEPEAIPDLSWEQLKEFHRVYYHPSNSWIFTYGDMPLAQHLDRIEELALRRFEFLNIDSSIAREMRLTSPRRVEETFPVGSDDPLAERSMFQMAWLTCPIEETFERAALGILTSLLLGNPAAPLYQALLDSRLGQNLCPGVGYHDDYRDTFFAAGLQGTDPEKIAEIETLILDTLQKSAIEGFPAERVAAALHQYEFSHREVSGDQYPYGLSLLMRMLGPWLHADDPVSPLQLEKNLRELRKAAKDPAFFPGMIRKHLLDNPHRISMLLRPDRSHAQREEELFGARLAQIEKHLDAAARQQLVDDALELSRGQDTQDDLSGLPNLELDDIDARDAPVAFTKTLIAQQEVFWFDQPTNGITYLTVQFGLDKLPQNLRPYLPLFCALLPQVGAAGRSYLEMARRTSAATGGIRLNTNILTDPTDIDIAVATIDLRSKALNRNLQEFSSILRDMLTSPDFNDLDRLRTVINQIMVTMENSISGSGHSFAARAAADGLTPATRLREEWSGLSQLLLIRNAAASNQEELSGLAGIFRQIAHHLLIRQNASVAVTSEKRHHAEIMPGLQSLLEALPSPTLDHTPTLQPFVPQPKIIGWTYNLPVAYVTKVFRTVPFTHPEAATLMVLAKLLRANFLHREIREKGGAYGGLAGNDCEGGLFSLLSYRDPHLVRTLEVYRNAIDWAVGGEMSDEMVKEAIIAVFGDLDRPLSPSGRGYREFLHQQQGLTLDMRQALRDAVLGTRRKDIARVAGTYLADGWASSSTGVLAGDEMFRMAAEKLTALGMQIKKL